MTSVPDYVIQPPKVLRLSYKCPRCDELHVFEGDNMMVFQAAWDVMSTGVWIVQIADNTRVLEEELDLAEKGQHQPQYVAKLMDVFKRLRMK